MQTAIKSTTFLSCNVMGYPVPVYRWYHVDEDAGKKTPVKLNHRVKQVSGTLIIKEARVEDSGKYLCIVNNSVGGESVETVLTVTAPLSADVEPPTQTVDFGRSASLTCEAAGNPVQSISWVKDGIPLKHSGRQLVIDSVRKEDKGMYQCFVRNEQESAQGTAELKLGGKFVPPEFKSTFPPSVKQPGNSLLLNCVANGSPTPVISWELDGVKVQTSDKLHIGQHTSNNGDVVSHLNITSLHTHDGGNYRCIASSKVGEVFHSARIDVYGLPYIRPMEKKMVVAGETLIVYCPVAGYPIDKITWEKNGRSLPVNKRQSVFSNGTLIIENVERNEDQGSYTCVAAHNQGYTAKGTIEIQVMVKPALTPFYFDGPLNMGDTAALLCLVSSGDGPFKLSWTFHGASVDSEVGVSTIKIDPKTSMLRISSATPHHSGIYTCKVTNDVGEDSHSAKLVVNVPPRWIIEPKDNAFALGKEAKIECKADGFPKPTITWKKAIGSQPTNYQDIKTDERSVKVLDDGTLVINNIQKSNEGYYLCEASNGIGTGLSAVVSINVQAPPQFEIEFRNQTAKRGETTLLTCEAKGETPIGILWNMNNKRLDSDSDKRYTIREDIKPNKVISGLTIKTTEREDSALFTCVATNAFGSDDTSINLLVQEAPEIPYGIKVIDKTGQSIQLSWNAPYDGNSPLTHYLIEYKTSKANWGDDGNPVPIPGQQSAATVFNLKPATNYHVRIRAVNEIGSSDPSDVVTIITSEEAPSSSPRDIRVESVDQHTLGVYWRPPVKDDWNGDINGYYVGHREAGKKKMSYFFETVEFKKEKGKEHYVKIPGLKTYTEYSIVIQAFNRVGSGPLSEEVLKYTGEGTPTEPPQSLVCTPLTSETIRVSWASPPLSSVHGVIGGYKVIYSPTDLWYDDTNKLVEEVQGSEVRLSELKKYTKYSIQVLAFTAGGDGVKSEPIECQTEQDVPAPPRVIKAHVMSEDSILLSWKEPDECNGVIVRYNAYYKVEDEPDENIKSVQINPIQTSHQITGLDKKNRYEFWVTASTSVGEGEPSDVIAQRTNHRVPAKIASFDDVFTVLYKQDVTLPCKAVGNPEIEWKIQGKSFTPNDRIKVLPDGSLLIKDVTRDDAGEYSCHVENSLGEDTITHKVTVSSPPFPPQVYVTATTADSIEIKLKPFIEDSTPVHGFILKYKPEYFNEWETETLPYDTRNYVLENLWCGTRYQISVLAFNHIGNGRPSEVANTRTKGEPPSVPEAHRFLEVSSTSVTLHLTSWYDGGCPMSYFMVEYKSSKSEEWTMVSKSTKPDGNFVVFDLSPATWYHLRATAHNKAGSETAEYEFATLTTSGGTIAPVREKDAIFSDWVSRIIESNMFVPIIATAIMVVIGLVLICVGVVIMKRRPSSFRLREEPAYNQSGAASTIDKRRLEFRDELGYIPPPNRKLPPVPGNNYNTCDRIKKGRNGSIRNHATWDPRRFNLYDELAYAAPGRRIPPPPSGESENIYYSEVGGHDRVGPDEDIHPYATFHLLGLREEMDPSRGGDHSQTFPYPPGHGGHARQSSQSMPHPRQDGRYTRVYNARNSTFSPEYDDPANEYYEDRSYMGCNGQLPTEYNSSHGSGSNSGSIGRRSLGHGRPELSLMGKSSPSPPLPPPRNGENKDNPESSFTECDRDLVNQTPVHLKLNVRDSKNSDETRKLLDRNDGSPVSLQNGLTPYDTVAV